MLPVQSQVWEVTPTVTFQLGLASIPSCDNLMQHFQSPSTSHSLLVVSLECPQCKISISNFILKSHQAYQLLRKEPKMQTLQQFPFKKKRRRKHFPFSAQKFPKSLCHYTWPLREGEEEDKKMRVPGNPDMRSTVILFSYDQPLKSLPL